jgi:hypothetical protein
LHDVLGRWLITDEQVSQPDQLKMMRAEQVRELLSSGLSELAGWHWRPQM